MRYNDITMFPIEIMLPSKLIRHTSVYEVLQNMLNFKADDYYEIKVTEDGVTVTVYYQK